MTPYNALNFCELSSGVSKLFLEMFGPKQNQNHRRIIVFILTSSQNVSPEVKMTHYNVLNFSELSSKISKVSLELFKSIQKPNHRPIIAFILPNYQNSSKFQPKWVFRSKNDTL